LVRRSCQAALGVHRGTVEKPATPIGVA